MTSGGRLPTWKERENNKRRERRRRAIAAKIYSGLRMYGGYKLPKHCDNNEVLKALCDEAGWAVEPDGTTYRKGCRPVEPMEIGGASTSASPRSSYQPSPFASYNPSPTSSYNPSPASSSYITNANGSPINGVSDANSLIPWLKNLSSSSSSAHSPALYMHSGSISAPVTPPLSSPSARSPRIKAEITSWPPGAHYTYLPSSTPASPGGGNVGPASPTFSLVSSNPFGFFVGGGGIASEGSSRMWTPGQSGMCSPVMNRGGGGDVRMGDCASDEFAFGSGGANGDLPGGGLVKPWEGERIHEECGSDELELTLGSAKTRG